MTLKTIYIARHGYRSNWLPPPHPEPPTGIDSDPPLAKHGEHQAEELAQYIASLDKTPQLIVSSPFYRCVQTAEPISKILNLPISLDRGIGEWFKIERDLHPVPGDLKLLSKFFTNLNHDYPIDQFVVPAPNGEDEEDVQRRCNEFLSKFVPFINEKYPQIEHVLLVTHAATKIALGMSLLGYDNPRDLLQGEHVIEDETRLRAGACSLDRFELDSANRNWALTMNGNVEFLSKGEEMNWSFEYGFEAGSDEDIKARALKSKEATADLEEEFDEIYVTVDVPSSHQISSSSNTSQYYNRVLIEELSQSNNKVADSTGNGNSGNKDQTASASEQNKTQLNSFYNSSSLQVSGLETDSPFFLINQQLYRGEYRKLNGTELIFNDNGDVIAKTRDKILLHKGDFAKKALTNPNGLASDLKTGNDPLSQQILAELPESLKKSNNPYLLEKLIEAKKLELEKTKA